MLFKCGFSLFAARNIYKALVPSLERTGARLVEHATDQRHFIFRNFSHYSEEDTKLTSPRNYKREFGKINDPYYLSAELPLLNRVHTSSITSLQGSLCTY